MIIDCELYHAPGERTIESLIALERQAGVDAAVVMLEPTIRPDNAWLRGQIAGHPELLGCACVNPQFPDAVDEFTRAARDWGFRGLKLMPPKHGYRIVDKAVRPLMIAAGMLGVPVSIHSGQEFCHPLDIAAVAADFPHVPVIMDHMGYRYYSRQALIAARQAPNLYLATTAIIEPHVIGDAVATAGAGRVLFGSNGPSVPPDLQLEVVRRAGLPAEDLAAVLGGNAARLYRLDPKPVLHG